PGSARQGAGDAPPALSVGYDVAVVDLTLVASLAFFTTAFTLFGVAGAHDSGGSPWAGAVGGGLAGMFFGLVAGGGLTGGLLLDAAFPPADGPRPTRTASSVIRATPPRPRPPGPGEVPSAASDQPPIHEEPAPA